MQTILEVKTGASAGKKIRLESGQSVRLGRTAKSDVVFPDDSLMSSLHCVLVCGESACHIQDNKSLNGVMVNGQKVAVATLRDGDEIAIGRTRLLVRISANAEGNAVVLPGPAASSVMPAAIEDAIPSEVAEVGSDLLRLLRTQFQPLYALLDAARDPKIIELLRASKDEYQSLYEGKKADELADFAPYLVRLPAQSTLLATLTREAWGQSWGVYLTCDQPLKDLRKHFRHFLMVQLPDGKEAYFRYYDPRVLRTFLPTCNAEETNQFFGPVKYFLMENENSQELLVFKNQGRGVAKKKFTVFPDEDAKNVTAIASQAHV